MESEVEGANRVRENDVSLVVEGLNGPTQHPTSCVAVGLRPLD